MNRMFYWKLLAGLVLPLNGGFDAVANAAVAPQEVVQSTSDTAARQPALSDLVATVQGYVDRELAVGGELLILQGGQPLLHQSFGFSDREQQRSWENDTICNIRSMTKSITSAAAQILIDRQELKLDETVASYLPAFDNDKSRLITVRQVLTHRAGMPLTNLLRPDQYESLADQVAAAGRNGPQFEPDSKFWYSDTGTDVVAALVEKIAGEPIQDFVQREIFDPLGMTHTFYGIDADDPRLAEAASLYLKMGDQGWKRFWRPEKPLYPFAWGSQTVYSTTTDYARFLQMLMQRGAVGDRQILSPDAVARMTEPVSRMKMLGSDASYPTGFSGLEVWYGQLLVTHRLIGEPAADPVILGHSGSDGTNAWAWPQRDLIILYFTQSRGGMTPLKIETPLDRLLINPTHPEDIPAELAPYLGTYMANYAKFDNEAFTVFVRDGKLVLDVPSQLAFELQPPDDEGRWAFAMLPDKVQASFDRDEQGKVIGLRLYQAGQVYEVPRQGTDRAWELAEQRKVKLAERQKQAAAEKLQVAWVGTLDMGVAKPVMQFRVVTRPSGETVAYFDSITEGRAGFAATWSIDAGQLKFDVAEIHLQYRGQLNEAGDTATGTWSQGGRDLPLTLKKQDQEYSDRTP